MAVFAIEELDFKKKFNLKANEADSCILHDEEYNIILSIFVDDRLNVRKNKMKKW